MNPVEVEIIRTGQSEIAETYRSVYGPIMKRIAGDGSSVTDQFCNSLTTK